MGNKALYDGNSTMYVLGSLLRQPDLLHESKYILSVEDFDGLHQVLFGAIYNLSVEGISTLVPGDVDLYLRQFSTKYEFYRKEGGFEYLQYLSELVDINFEKSQFDFYYERVKKFTILRDFQKNGIDIKQFYNPDAGIMEMDAENAKLNDLEIHEIFEAVREKIAKVEDKNISKENLKAINAGFGLKELVDELARSPEVGSPFDGEILNAVTRGARLGKFYLYSAPTGHGKALLNKTKIPTFYNGLKEVGEIKENDFLIDRNGKPTKVLGVFPQGKQEVYKVIFKDGREALCNNEHLWTYHYGDPRYGNNKTNTLKEIIDIINKEGYQNNDGLYRIKVPLNQPIEYGRKELSIDPYLMGLLLGDGSFREQPSNRNLSFTTTDVELINEIVKITGWSVRKSSDNNYNYYFSDNNGNIHVKEFLINYPELLNKYSIEKFIPKEFLYGSIEQRFALLQGLMDTDGTLYNNKARFSTSSKQLKNDFIELIQSLGYIASSIEIDNRKEHINYIIQIGAKTSEKIKFFRLQRKIDKIDLTKRSEKYDYNPIIKIEKMNYQEEMTCFLVDNEEHLFLMNDYIVTHNTRFLVGNACALSMPRIENGQVITSNHLSSVLFIATEMEPDEIQTLILAYVSGVDEGKILNHTYNLEEKKLIDIAVKLVEQYSANFKIEKISDPSISVVRSKIIKYILTDKTYHIFYDYIFTSPSLNMEFSRTGLREDVTLMMLANTLKEVAADYDVFIFSGTQVNRDWEKRQFRNENNIAGSKAIADKADIGVIATKLTEEEKEEIGTLLKEIDAKRTPNIVIDVYKNRRGQLVNVKVFREFDYGTCRAYDVICTDTNYRQIHGLNKYSWSYQVRDLLEVVVDKRSGSTN